MTKNDQARKYGIPKFLRQYAKRYGVDVEDIVQTHRKNRVPMLGHWAERKRAMQAFIKAIQS